MTTDELTALERLAGAATPGPWRSTGGESDDMRIVGWTNKDVVIGGCGCCGSPYSSSDGNHAFIAAARTAVPALVAEVRRLRALVAAWGSEVMEAERTHFPELVVEHTSATDAALAEARRILDGGA